MANTFQLNNSHIPIKIYHIHLRTYQEVSLFGQIEGERISLNAVGRIAADEWQQAANHYKGIRLDSWVILPSGIRALIRVQDNSRGEIRPIGNQTRSQVKPRALNTFVAGFKAAAAKRINLVRNQPGAPVWQRGYHEQRIEDEITLTRIRRLLARTPEIQNPSA